ncbi:MAG TPA: hypothetical protein VGC66_20060 [Pyrinomonadaceae bacterium]
MADENRKCKHPTCDCQVSGKDNYCSEYCREAEASGVTEIGCGCEHSACR